MTGRENVIERVSERIAGYGRPRAVVAFSGGVDSAVVLALAARALGRTAVTAVTAVSPSYPAGELEQARDVATSLGVAHRSIETGEVGREAYARNDGERCFHCKTELYGALRRLAAGEADPDAAVLAGANLDDLADFRPGLRAARQQGIRNPLLEDGVGKAAVRAAARRLGLAVADKPSLACLSSRVAYGIRITPGLLGRVDRAERSVRALGFEVVRVRHLGDRASIEVDPADVPRLVGDPRLPSLMEELREAGWSEVAVDPKGYRTGSLNPTLRPPTARRRLELRPRTT
ncbi:MAG TPA: ATP-dependent sacrificial sulfur transferase LarE [Actinomycetota bacterium]